MKTIQHLNVNAIADNSIDYTEISAPCNPCALFWCQNSGKCINSSCKPECKCDPPFSGILCESIATSSSTSNYNNYYYQMLDKTEKNRTIYFQ